METHHNGAKYQTTDRRVGKFELHFPIEWRRADSYILPFDPSCNC